MWLYTRQFIRPLMWSNLNFPLFRMQWHANEQMCRLGAKFQAVRALFRSQVKSREVKLLLRPFLQMLARTTVEKPPYNTIIRTGKIFPVRHLDLASHNQCSATS